jgi:oligogalacturonide lyase
MQVASRDAVSPLHRETGGFSTMRLMDRFISRSCCKFGFALLLSATLIAPQGAQLRAQSAVPLNTPKTWIDEVTGHRILRLSDEPDSKALYFNENAYTPDGEDMIYVSPQGIHVLHFATLQSHILWSGKVDALLVGTRTRRVFFRKQGDPHLLVIEIDTMKVRNLGPLPPGVELGSINSDETKIAGTFVEGNSPKYSDLMLTELQDEGKALQDARQLASQTNTKAPEPPSPNKAKAVAMEKRMAAHITQALFVMNISTGKMNFILKGTDWLNHVQFSPTDPDLIMYCHEGPSLAVDRIWTIRADGSHNQLMHKRAGPSGIATHEFWSHDGKTIWFDLQKTRGEEFAVAGIDVATGKITDEYHLDKALASLHYNISADGKVFCGDGDNMAHGLKASGIGHRAEDRAWIRFLRPNADGTLHSIRLAHLADNNYHLTEPNPRFSPDNKLVIFTSDMLGPNYVFAVEVAKTKPDEPTATP